MAGRKKFDIDGTALFGDYPWADTSQNEVYTGPGRPRNEALIREPGGQQGLPKTHTRQTFIVRVDQLDTLKNYAYTERKKIKEIVEEAFGEYIEKYVNPDELLTRPKNWK